MQSKILFITQYFVPEPKFVRSPEFLRELASQCDVNISVLTGVPNYPTGKIYEGYKLKIHQTEKIEGMLVHRVFLVPNHSKSIFKRGVNFLSFMLSVTIFLLLNGRKYQKIIVYHPSIFPSFVTTLYKKFFNQKLKVIIDYPHFFMFMIDIMQKFILVSADRVLVISNGFKSLLVQRYPIDEKMISVCYNSSRANAASKEVIKRGNVTDKIRYVFTGNLGLAQDLERLVLAFGSLENPCCRILDIYGSGVCEKDLSNFVKQNHFKNIKFHGQTPQQQLVSKVLSYDAAFLSLMDAPIFRVTIPSKYQFYLSQGRPVISNVEGDVNTEINQSDIGITALPGSVKEWQLAIQKFENLSLSDRIIMSKNSLNLFNSQYTQNSCVRAYSKKKKKA